jgi:hypothetical protein
MEYKNIEQIKADLKDEFFDEDKRFYFYRYGDFLFYQDLEAIGNAIDKRLEADDDLYSDCTVMEEDGTDFGINIKFDDGYEEGTEDDNVDFFCSGHHLCRLTNPRSGEGHILVGFNDYEAKTIKFTELAEQVKKIQPETRFDAVILWRDEDRLENVTMKMGLEVGADDENIFYNVENADDMFGLMVGKSDEWILVGFADGANQFNYTAL